MSERNKDSYNCLRVAIKQNNLQNILNVYKNETDRLKKLQLAFLLARNRVLIEEEDTILKSIISNQMLSKYFV